MYIVKADIDNVEHLYILSLFVCLWIALSQYEHKLRQLQHYMDAFVWIPSNITWTKTQLNITGQLFEFVLQDYKSSNLRYFINRARRKIKYFLS
jgi:hypothetical protein